MIKVLVVWLTSELVTALQKRLEGVLVDDCGHLNEVLPQLKDKNYSLLVLNDNQAPESAQSLLTEIRSDKRLCDLPIIFCVQKKSVDGMLAMPEELVDSLQLMFHPFDRIDLTNQIVTNLDLLQTKAETPLKQSQKGVLDLVAQIWAEEKEHFLDQVSGLAEVTKSLKEDRFTMELQRVGR